MDVGLILIAAATVVGVGAMVYTLRTFRWFLAGKPSDAECVACGSKALEASAPDIYTCRECGYEGGSGRAALRDAQEAARCAALTPQERVDVSTQHLMAASRLLSNYSSSLIGTDVALRIAGLDDLSGDEGLDQSKLRLARDVLEAANELRAAARVSAGQVTLDNGRTVDAEALASTLAESEEKLLSGLSMRVRANEVYETLSSALQSS